MNNKILIAAIAIIIVVLSAVSISVNGKKQNEIGNPDSKHNVYLFYGDGCVYCDNLKEYLKTLPKEVQNKFNFVQYEVWSSKQNTDLMNEVGNHFKDEVSGVPYLVIGAKTFSGYAPDYNDDILNAINDLEKNYYDVMNEIK